MAITLRGLLRGADEEGQFTLNHPDGTTSTLPFEQRNFGYGEGAGKLNFNTQPPFIINDFDGRPLPGVEQSTNSNLGNLINDVTNNFVRGGAVTLVKRAATDFERLGKVLLSANGISFIAAQFALARTNPQNIISPTNRLFNSLPVPGTSLLATAATGAAGIRFRRDGLADIKTESGYNYDPERGGPKYESNFLAAIRSGINEVSDNSLFGAYNKIIVDGDLGIIKEYAGGPHSIFGIGDTTIKQYKSNPFNDIGENGGYLPLFNQDLFQLRQAPLTPSSKHKDYRSVAPISGQFPIEDSKTRINLYKLGDPGVDLSDDDVDVYDVRTIDKISAASIFQRKDLEDFSGNFKDYIKFRIAVVDTDNPLNDNIILFRALLDSINDNYSGEWNSHKYNGRAENFYTYAGFDRKISFGFKIHTQTRHEQKPLWRKLNYLVAQTAPEYKNRRMRGVFSRLTIGDWMNEIPGFFTSVGLSWSTAYPWEIRHDSEGVDRDLNEYPHILDVSCEFQPVHNFAPSNSPTTPFILPEIGVSNNRKYAKQSDDEDQDQFSSNGVSINATTAET
jgi:hypothetical protein